MLDRLNRVSIGIAAVSVFAMAIIGGIDVVGASFFHHPFPAAYELTELLMVPAVILAFAPLQARKMNISVDLIVSRAGPRIRRWFDLLAIVLGLGLFALIAWQGWLMALDSVQIREYAQGAYRIPVYPFKLAFAAGVTLVTIQYGKDLFATVRTIAALP